RSKLICNIFLGLLCIFYLQQAAKRFEEHLTTTYTGHLNYEWYENQPLGNIATTNLIPSKANFFTGNPSVLFSERLSY
ncbi:hypothetical protein Q6325_30395, partial [Klebsiella pneumoniae]|uniref:hypothetical protein n=1 Tax=Klebsiella pneumoniae TaxID=573 RepID=UPI0027306DE7